MVERKLPGGQRSGQIAVGSSKITLESDVKLWMERCAERGFTTPTWPTEYGGGGLTPQQAKILFEEMAEVRARTPLTVRDVYDRANSANSGPKSKKRVIYPNC